jgi:hypothetical protein
MSQNGAVYILPRKPMAAPKTSVSIGGEAVVVVTGPIRGGYVQNPSNAESSLFLDFVNTPGCINRRCTTLEIRPGETIQLPILHEGVQVKANAISSNHRFTAIVW